MLRPLGMKWKDLRRTVSQCEGKVAECNHVCGVHFSDYSTGHTNSAFVLIILKFRFWHILFFSTYSDLLLLPAWILPCRNLHLMSLSVNILSIMTFVLISL